RQFSLIQNAQTVLVVFNENPRGFRPPALDAQDFFSGAHCRSLTCLYHDLWPKTRLKRQNASLSCAIRFACTTAAITKRPRRRSSKCAAKPISTRKVSKS